MCCRDLTKAEEASKDIRKESGSDLVEVLHLDLASLKSVRKCAETLIEKEDKIGIKFHSIWPRKDIIILLRKTT